MKLMYMAGVVFAMFFYYEVTVFSLSLCTILCGKKLLSTAHSKEWGVMLFLPAGEVFT